MPIKKQIRVGGALYVLVSEPTFDGHMKRYVTTVRHADNTEQVAYSRLPGGPFVFHVPNSERPCP